MLDYIMGMQKLVEKAQEKMVKDICMDIGLTEEFLDEMSVSDIQAHLKTINVGLNINADKASNLESHHFNENADIIVIMALTDDSKDECISMLHGSIELTESGMDVESRIVNEDFLEVVNKEYREWRDAQ